MTVDTCFLCVRSRLAGEPGWSTFTSKILRCPTCSSGAVETRVDARRHLPSVRAEMASLGIRLDQRVLVTLVEPDHLNDGDAWQSGQALCLGRTVQRWWVGRPAADVLGIEIVRGLTATHFGATVAHEIGHAWLGQRGAVALDPLVEEGLCELFAGAWLKRQGTPLASAVRRSALDNPDPTYGGGYRLVRDAVIRHGIDDVLDAVCTRSALP